EGEEAARAWHLRVAEHVVQPGRPLSDFGFAARHRNAAGDRAGALELYDRWALDLRYRHAYAACVQIAQEGLLAFPTGHAEAERVGAAKLWTRIYDGLVPLGNVSGADQALDTVILILEGLTSPEARLIYSSALLRRGRRLAASGQVTEAEGILEKSLEGFMQAGNNRDRAIVLGEIARLRVQAGDVAGALNLHEESIATFEQLGDVRERAVTLGDIARLRAQAGDVAGALKLHEERIAIFEQLGDVRERAVTLGDIARLRAQAGDIAGALNLLVEMLEICRTLGDLEGIGYTQFALAQLNLGEGKTEEAQSRLAEAWEIVVQIGHVDAIAAAGSAYGRLLLNTDREQARSVLQGSRDAYQLLGWTAKAREIEGLLQEK
ncbi:MAG: hypothetical protein QOJ16_4141, partial [Acidobacteriota bacterium]|nr:hypothetical protein [Acidobacteriota bacterium]